MSGRMRERVRIEREARTSDNAGGAVLTWTTVAVLWAAVEPLKGTERMQAMQMEASNLYKITLRNPGPAFTAADRLVWLTGGNAVLNIREAPTTPRYNLFREVVAELGVAQ